MHCHARAFYNVIPLTGLDLFASDIETCKHISASLGSVVIPASVPGSPLFKEFHAPVHRNELWVLRVAPIPALLDFNLAWAHFAFDSHFAVERKRIIVQLRIVQQLYKFIPILAPKDIPEFGIVFRLGHSLGKTQGLGIFGFKLE